MYSKKRNKLHKRKRRSDSNETKHKTYIAQRGSKKRKTKRKNFIANNILSKKDV
jgi:hypothetical protein